MVMSQKENQNDWKVGVLSPRVTGVVGKGGSRRTTMTGMRDMSAPSDRGGHVRLSSVAAVGGVGSGVGGRGSLMPGGKGVWR